MTSGANHDRLKGIAAIILLTLFGAVTLMYAGKGATSISRSLESEQTFFDGPISFEPNRGQAERDVKFVARGPGYVLYLTDRGTLLSLRQDVGVGERAVTGSIAVNLADSSHKSRLVALGALPGNSSYFIGADRKEWITGIPNFSEVQFQEVHPGIHVTCRGRHGSLEYDFKVAPGAMTRDIVMEIMGASSIQLTASGDLAIRTRQAELRFQKPNAYQEIDGAKRPVTARFVVNKRRVTFALGSYDRSKLLIIDPVLSYSNHLQQPQVSTGQSGLRPGLKKVAR
ncbi:MAG TPA: hypothetical protein VFA68_17290 [Terriglobales bacterium]|nr:hypothetical protein [Terriglobales bacterium]